MDIKNILSGLSFSAYKTLGVHPEKEGNRFSVFSPNAKNVSSSSGISGSSCGEERIFVYRNTSFSLDGSPVKTPANMQPDNSLPERMGKTPSVTPKGHCFQKLF